jgi:hypothetical protein
LIPDLRGTKDLYVALSYELFVTSNPKEDDELNAVDQVVPRIGVLVVDVVLAVRVVVELELTEVDELVACAPVW